METDFEALGSVNITRLDGSITFYSFRTNGTFIKREDKELCGGNCEEFL